MDKHTKNTQALYREYIQENTIDFNDIYDEITLPRCYDTLEKTLKALYDVHGLDYFIFDDHEELSVFIYDVFQTYFKTCNSQAESLEFASEIGLFVSSDDAIAFVLY